TSCFHIPHCSFTPPPPPSTPLFFSTAPATPETYTLSLHDALPILPRVRRQQPERLLDGLLEDPDHLADSEAVDRFGVGEVDRILDRKSTRLNSSHVSISYAVFCLKKKKKQISLGCRVIACEIGVDQ